LTDDGLKSLGQIIGIFSEAVPVQPASAIHTQHVGFFIVSSPAVPDRDKPMELKK
jgi:hypothetical protein